MANPTLDRITGIDVAIKEAAILGCVFIMIGNGKFALLDYNDFLILHKYTWRLHTGGYAIRRNGAVHTRMHNDVLPTVEGMEPDHINRNKLDNRRANLRLVTRSQNRANCPRRKHNKSSQFKGVRPMGKNRWVARIRFQNIEMHLGSFSSQEDAARCYNENAVKYFGECAYLNPV